MLIKVNNNSENIDKKLNKEHQGTEIFSKLQYSTAGVFEIWVGEGAFQTPNGTNYAFNNNGVLQVQVYAEDGTHTNYNIDFKALVRAGFGTEVKE